MADVPGYSRIKMLVKMIQALKLIRTKKDKSGYSIYESAEKYG